MCPCAEKFDSVNAKWYSVVGTPLIATTVANFLMPIVECWVSALQARARRGAVLRRVGARLCCQMAGSAADVAYTQTQLNRWHESPPWNVAVGFSEMLLNIFVILLYSSGIPILYAPTQYRFRYCRTYPSIAVPDTGLERSDSAQSTGRTSTSCCASLNATSIARYSSRAIPLREYCS